jgi:hypothetical protein
VQRGVSSVTHRHDVPRRRHQLDELRDLCRSGRVSRAVDLAFEHFAMFGRDDAVVDLLADALERDGGSTAVRRRLAELDAASPP